MTHDIITYNTTVYLKHIIPIFQNTITKAKYKEKNDQLK